MQHVLGQPRAINTLQRQLVSGRVHHAQIFHGPQGVGKFTTAVAFARLLLCHDPKQNDESREACGHCASCRLLPSAATGGFELSGDDDEATLDGSATSPHPDLHVLTKELAAFSDDAATRRRKQISIPVELVREHVIGPAFRSARLGHGKVFVIDEAELLNAAGQNALLKTLEEPPLGSTLILVTSSEDRLLATIRSRCQRVAFVPLENAILAADLDRRGLKLNPADRDWLLQFAGGSLGRLDMALHYGLNKWAREVIGQIERLTRGRPAPTLGGQMHELQDAFAEAWVKEKPNSSKEAANKLAASLMAALIAEHARHHLSQIAAKTEPHDPDAAEVMVEPWLGVIDAVHEAQSLQARAVNPALVSDYLASALESALAPAGT